MKDKLIQEGGDAPLYIPDTGTQTEDRHITLQGFVNYQRTFGKHEFTGLFVAEKRENQGSFISARRNNFAVCIDEMNMGSSIQKRFRQWRFIKYGCPDWLCIQG